MELTARLGALKKLGNSPPHHNAPSIAETFPSDHFPASVFFVRLSQYLLTFIYGILIFAYPFPFVNRWLVALALSAARSDVDSCLAWLVAERSFLL